MKTKNKFVTIPRAIGFGMIDIIGGGAFTIIGAWLLYFFTVFVGLTPIEASSIVAIARIIDAIICLFMGSITDHFYKNILGKKFGRRRFFLIIGAPLMLVYALLWIQGMSYLYYLAVYLAFEIIVAMVMIPWETLPSEMTTDYSQRTKLSTCRMFISAIGTFLATFVPGLLIAKFGENNAMAYFYNGLFFAIFFTICVVISYCSTWERPITKEMEKELESKNQNKSNPIKFVLDLFKEYLSTLKVRAFRKHLAIYLLSFTGKDIYNTVFVFFCVYCLSISASIAGSVLSLSIIGLPVTLIAGFAFVKFGPKKLLTSAYIIMLICLLLTYMIYYFNPSSKILFLFIIGTVYQIGRCLMEFTPWNIFPFIPDVDEMITKKRREGLFAAVMTFCRKTTVAISTFCVGLILEFGGFVEKQATQSPEAITTIALILFLGTGTLIFLALLVTQTFNLNKQTHNLLINAIDVLQSDGKPSDLSIETKSVVEDLTGYSCEQLFDKK